MLSDIINMILIPIRYFITLLFDDGLESYLGVPVIAIPVTGIITLIVIKALLNPVAIGSVGANMYNDLDRRDRREAAAIAHKFHNVRVYTFLDKILNKNG